MESDISKKDFRAVLDILMADKSMQDVIQLILIELARVKMMLNELTEFEGDTE